MKRVFFSVFPVILLSILLTSWTAFAQTEEVVDEEVIVEEVVDEEVVDEEVVVEEVVVEEVVVEEETFSAKVEEKFGVVVSAMAAVLFYPVPGLSEIITPVTLEIELEGEAGSEIPDGTVISIDEREFATTEAIILDENGSGSVSIKAQDQERIAPVEEGVFTFDTNDGSTLSVVSLGSPSKNTAPFIVVWLILGAIFFTLRMGFINIRGFVHAIKVTAGNYDNPDDPGEVTHFQALSSALSATVGLGNIAGVAIAVSIGGAGAVFWMIIAAFLGMSTKFVEVTLGQKYRVVDEEGRVLGGPMRYLKDGLERRGLGVLGTVLATVFAIFTIGGSIGGGNMFQANQAYMAVNEVVPFEMSKSAFGIFLMITVGIVILGGIKRIAQTAEKIVPLMVSIYVLGAVFVLITNFSEIPHAVQTIISSAFHGTAVAGGILGTIVQGFKRAAFSNEAGVGSAAIAHAAAKTDEPVREGLVALLEPFIDTIIVCFATGIVIVISGVLDDQATAALEGVNLTAAAFKNSISWFPNVLAVAVLLFAYSTMISWSYYGERAWTSLFGQKSSIVYKIIFLFFTYIGTVATLGAVIDFSDLMILSMAFPNILGLYILSGEVKIDLKEYMRKLKANEFKVFK